MFDPMVRTHGVQWKSDKNIKHYLTQMLLVLNWCYWQVEKNLHMHMKVQGHLMQVNFIELHQVFAKKKSDTFLTNLVLFIKAICFLYFVSNSFCSSSLIFLRPFFYVSCKNSIVISFSFSSSSYYYYLMTEIHWY